MAAEKNILRGSSRLITLPADLSLGQFIFDRISSHGDRVALINGQNDEKITYAEILSKSLKLAIYLKSQGLRKDDRIAVCSENSLNFSIPICSALYLGMTNCPLNPGYSRAEFIHALNISRPKFIFASRSAMEKLSKIVGELPWSPRVVSMDKSVGSDPCMDDLISSITAPNPENFKIPQLNPREHVAAILCSSGTTGLPKGVMLTDRNFLTVAYNVIEKGIMNNVQGVHSLVILPYFHAYAFVVMNIQLLTGVTTVVLPRFEADQFLAVVGKYKIQNLILVPPLMVFLAKSPVVDRYDLSSVKGIWCGAAPLSPDIERIVCKKLNLSSIHKGYGLTETTLGVLATDMNVKKPGSVGKLGSEVLGKVMPLDGDGSEQPLGPNQRGELCFKGDLIMKGYCGDVSSTAAVIDKDGWLHTGDIGYYDEDGYFYIVDRHKELIKYKAFQVPPAELEALLLTHTDVDDAAVVGLPDEECGELPLAFVVRRQGSTITASDVQKFVNERVSSAKWLRGGVRFIDAIPKSATGKILRRELRDALRSKL